jgi:pimeloyl-ACP methyl ester carboxylesterase
MLVHRHAINYNRAMQNNESVLLLHGIARTSRHMRRLKKHFEALGYHVLSLNYPSRKFPLKDLAAFVEGIVERQVPKDNTLHIIGYSMGGLVARAYLHRSKRENIGRVLLLATPNGGSEIADLLKKNRLYRWFYGPAGLELLTDARCREGLFGPCPAELGVIAGNATIDPFSSFVIGRANDGKVAVESAKLEGMKDMVLLRANHTFFPGNRRVIAQAEHFIQNGCFSRERR